MKVRQSGRLAKKGIIQKIKCSTRKEKHKTNGRNMSYHSTRDARKEEPAKKCRGTLSSTSQKAGVRSQEERKGQTDTLCWVHATPGKARERKVEEQL